MKKVFAAGLLVSGIMFFGACSSSSDITTSADTMTTAPADGTMTDQPTTTTDTGMMAPGAGMENSMNEAGATSDGSTTGSGLAGGSANSGKGSTLGNGFGTNTNGSATVSGSTDSRIKPASAVRGKTLTRDGTVKDRDNDGKVGTAEAAEDYRHGREAVKNVFRRDSNKVHTHDK